MKDARAEEGGDPSFGRNIRRILAYQALTNFSLFLPVWIVFLHADRHLTLAQIYLIAGVGWIVQATADVPLGAIADAVGRKVTIVSGTCLLTVGLALLAVLPGFLGMAAGYLFWAIGTAAVSGTDMAMLSLLPLLARMYMDLRQPAEAAAVTAQESS